MINDFRFSTNVFGITSADEFATTCRRAERQGYDTLYAPDHLGSPSPFPTLVAAANATERLRVGTLVLNASFWNPALLAREIATTDILTGGRLEIGLGAGHMRWEYEEAGIPWEPIGDRADRLTALIDELGRLFAAGGYEQQAARRTEFGTPELRPTQRLGFGGYGPPLLVGGTGDRTLRLAAERADIIGVGGLLQIPGRPPGTFRLATATETDERVHVARSHAGDRADTVEWQALIQRVELTDDRQAAAERLANQYANAMTPDDLLDNPFLLLGTTEEVATQLHARHTRYGFTHFTVHAPFMDAFAQVIAHVREREGA